MKDLLALFDQVEQDFNQAEKQFADRAKQVKAAHTVEQLENLNGAEKTKRRLDQLGMDIQDESFGLERILGDNNLMDIHFLTKGLEVAQTVCRIVEWPGEWKSKIGIGTGFLMGRQLLMTNNHVIESPDEGNVLYAEFEYERKPPHEARTYVFRLDPDTFFHTNHALDYTVVAVQPVSMDNEKQLETYTWNELRPSGDRVIVGEAVNIIQHPMGRHKMIAFRENKIVEMPAPYIHYTADTQRGSSGSLVANEDWEIIALHRSSVPERDEQGRILLHKGGYYKGPADEQFVIWRANQGVLIDHILEDLNQVKLGGGGHELLDMALENYEPPKTELKYNLPGSR